MAGEAPYRALESFTRHGVKYAAGQAIPEARRWVDLRERQRLGLVSWEPGREADAKVYADRRLRMAPKPEGAVEVATNKKTGAKPKRAPRPRAGRKAAA